MHGCVANDAGMSHKDAHRRRICRPNIPAGSPVGNGRKWYMSIITNHHSTSHPLDRIGSDHREMDTTRTWLHYCRWTLSESGHKASRCSWSVVITNQWPPPIRIHSSIFLSSLLCRCCTMPMHASPGRWWSSGNLSSSAPWLEERSVLAEVKQNGRMHAPERAEVDPLIWSSVSRNVKRLVIFIFCSKSQQPEN